MEIFQLLGTIAINNAAANAAIDDTTGRAEQSSSKIGSTFKKIGAVTAKAMVVATTAAATGIAAITKAAVSGYGDYEQLVGGVETLFKDSSGKVVQYADNAYKTAGLSANQYMETVTSFSASLLQGLGGDTAKAAEVADLAITDMSDNANKMGSSMADIQNAYQGFAKQNYTMLDNLKLGYGGTQAEMVRLINDSGVLKEKIDSMDGVSFDTMIQAIHAVQTNMGITGTTAKEAATTIQGSIASAKGAWDNFLVGLAAGDQNMKQLTQNLGNSIVTVADNIIPRVQTTLESIGILVETVVPPIIQKLPSMVMQVLPSLLSSAVSVVTSIGSTLLTALQENLPQMMQSGAEMINKLGEGIQNNLPQLIDKGLTMILNLTQTLRDNAPQLIQAGLNLIVNLAQGLMDALPSLISKVPTIVSNIAGIINDNAPKLIATAAKLIATLAKGLIQAIPTLVSNIPKIIKAVVDVFLAYNWLALGKNIITMLKNGISNMVGAVKTAGTKIKDAIVNIIKKLPQNLYNLGKQAIQKLASIIRGAAGIKDAAGKIVSAVVNTISKLPAKMLKIGGDLVKGLWNGIGNAKDWILGKIKGFGDSILSGIKSFFGIHSPSKVMEEQVGKQLALGVAEGIKKNTKYAKKSAAEMAQVVLDAAQKRLDRYKTYNNMSLKDEVEYWNEIRKKCKAGTDARLQADQQYFAAKESLYEQQMYAELEYQAAIDAANQKIVDRTKAILQAFNLFEEFAQSDPVESSSLITNLESQVNALDEWQKEIGTLEGKLGDTDLFRAIQEMGVSSLAQVKAINAMTEEQLKQYVDLYNKRQELAKQQATAELGDEVLTDIQTAMKQYESTITALNTSTKKKFGEIAKTIKTKTEESAKATVTKLQTMLQSFTTGTKGMADVTAEKFNSILSKIQGNMSSAVTSVKSAVDSMIAELERLEAEKAAAAAAETTTTTTTTTKKKVAKHAAGGILTEPTIFGYSPMSGTYHMGGEAGAEAVAPIDVLQDYVRTAVAESSNNAEVASLLGQMVELLQKILKETGNAKIELDGREFGRMVKGYAG